MRSIDPRATLSPVEAEELFISRSPDYYKLEIESAALPAGVITTGHVPIATVKDNMRCMLTDTTGAMGGGGWGNWQCDGVTLHKGVYDSARTCRMRSRVALKQVGNAANQAVFGFWRYTGGPNLWSYARLIYQESVSSNWTLSISSTPTLEAVDTLVPATTAWIEWDIRVTTTLASCRWRIPGGVWNDWISNSNPAACPAAGLGMAAHSFADNVGGAADSGIYLTGPETWQEAP